MFLWDDVGETRIRFDRAEPQRGVSGTGWANSGLAGLLEACTVPIAVHDHARAAILGTGTLLACDGHYTLLTAAHLFDAATTSGNWLVPERGSGQLLSLEGAQVRVLGGADIAMVDLARTRELSRLLTGRVAMPLQRVLRRRKHRATDRSATFCLAGFPAVWSRFERGFLAAKRLTITTRQHDDPAEDLRCVYGRVAERGDGRMIHTPALEGMSGAAIWKIGANRGGALIELAGVQSAFLHSRYLRGDAIASIEPFLHR